jgi:hypothetical protein
MTSYAPPTGPIRHHDVAVVAHGKPSALCSMLLIAPVNLRPDLGSVEVSSFRVKYIAETIRPASCDSRRTTG